jgi:hypothetical protein
MAKVQQTENVTLNKDQSLYVIPCQGGYSCYGFDVLFDKVTKLNAWLAARGYEKSAPDESERGTMAVYLAWKDNCAIAFQHCTENGIRCDIDLTPQLIGKEGKVVKVINKWGEVDAFKVGRSTGWMPIHLAVEGKRENYGGGVLGAPFQSIKVLA